MEKLMIPKNLKMKQLTDRYQTTAINGFHTDKVHYICHSIYRQMQYLDNNVIYPGKEKCYYVPLCAGLLKNKLGNSYKKIVDWMIGAGIIRVDNSWLNGVISQGYKLTDKYLGAGRKWVTITYWPLLKRKNNLQPPPESKSWQGEKRVVGGLKRWLEAGGLKIDDKAARDVVEQLYNIDAADAKNTAEILKSKVRYYSRLYTIDVIAKGNLYLLQDDYGYRLHSPLTQLKKELRGMVTYDGQELVQVDIKNSQLFFMLYLLNWRNWNVRGFSGEKKFKIWKGISQTNNTDKHHYSHTIMFLKSLENQMGKGFQESNFIKDACNGLLYESITNNVDNSVPFYANMPLRDSRKWVKKTLLEQLFCNPVKDWYYFEGNNGKVWDSFRELYPEVMRVIDEIKGTHFKHISRLLQRIESTAILSYVCKTMQGKHPDIPIFTIHDCLVTPLKHTMVVQQIMEQSIMDFVGFKPKLDIKPWGEYQDDLQELLKAA